MDAVTSTSSSRAGIAGVAIQGHRRGGGRLDRFAALAMTAVAAVPGIETAG